MDRRRFLETGSYAALASTGFGQLACARAGATGRLDQIGVQLYTVRDAMAHQDEATTLEYLDEHQMPYKDAGIVFTPEIIGGKF